MIHEEKLPICVAIQLNTIEQAIKDCFCAINRGARFIEFRLDYYSGILSITKIQIKKLVQSSNVPVILTLRRKEEGGQQKLDENKRIDVLKLCILSQPAFIDIEASLPLEILADIYSLATIHNVGIIYSFHDFEKTPSIELLITQFDKLVSKCPGIEPMKQKRKMKQNILTQNPLYLIKIICFAKEPSDNQIIFALNKYAHEKGVDCICFAMGPLGIPSRVFSIKHGSFFSFASIQSSQGTAPGQISIEEFYEIYNHGE